MFKPEYFMKDLFGIEVKPGSLVKAVKGTRLSVIIHQQLIHLYGKCDGKKCGSCKHLYFRVYSKKYPKCRVSGLEGSTQNHDWSSRWLACGKYEEQVKE